MVLDVRPDLSVVTMNKRWDPGASSQGDRPGDGLPRTDQPVILLPEPGRRCLFCRYAQRWVNIEGFMPATLCYPWLG